MKNKEVNRKVLMAISIGLSAALSLMPTVSVLADDDVEPENGGNDTSDESQSEESHESDENNEVKDSVSEASEAVSEAINEATEYSESESAESESFDSLYEAGQTETAENAETVKEDSSNTEETDTVINIADELSEVSEAMNSIDNDVTALDQANYVTEEANADYVAAEVSYAETKISEAETAVSEVSKAVDEANDYASNRKEDTAAAAIVIYSSEADASEAKEEAEKAVDEVQVSIAENQEAVEKAQEKLDAASTALEIAEGAVESAAKEKADADAAEHEAREKLEILLKEGNISYEEKEDGSIEFAEDTDIDSRTRKAIEAAHNAYIQAKADADEAAEAYKASAGDAYKAATDKADAAQERLDAANKNYDNCKDNFKEDAELDALLDQIREQQEIIKDVTTTNDYWSKNRELTARIAVYMLAQEEGVERDSIVISRKKDGTVLQNIAGQNCIEISYRAADSDEIQYAYFDYYAYYRDGDYMGSGVHDGAKDAGHIIVLKKEVTGKNASGKATSFAGKGEAYVSELSINNGSDAYQSAKIALSKAEAEKAEAQAMKEEADLALQNYADVESAKTALSKAETDRDEAKAAFRDDDRMEELVSLIKAQQDVVKNAKSSDAYWKTNRVLAEYFVEYSLRQSGNLTDFELVRDSHGNVIWNNGKGNGTMHHYFTVKYVENGVEQTGYYDYIAYYNNGETVTSSGSAQNTPTHMSKSTIYDASSDLTPDHIVVVKKNNIALLQDGQPYVFSDKGDAFFSEADFNAGTDAYQSAKQRIDALEQAVQNAQVAVSVAESIQTLKAEAEATDSLRAKVEAAKEKVQAAAEALKKARVTQAVNADKLAELTEQLESARKEYDEASESLETAQKKLVDMQDIVDSMLDSIDSGFTYRTIGDGSNSNEEESSHQGEADTGDSTDEETVDEDGSDDNEAVDTDEESADEETTDDRENSEEETPDETETDDESDDESDSEEDSDGSEDSDGNEDTDDSEDTDESKSEDAVDMSETERDDPYTDISSVTDDFGVDIIDGSEVIKSLETDVPGESEGAAFTRVSAPAGVETNTEMPDAGVLPDGGEILDDDVLGQRMAPIVEALENGTFTRGMMFTEDGLKVSFMWWLLIVALGAKGVQMYVKSRKKKAEK